MRPTVAVKRNGVGLVQLSMAQAVPRSDDEKAAEAESTWVPAGRSVTIAGYTIAGGMLYIGERLDAVSEWRGVEPALIDPRLPVDSTTPDRAGHELRYWPSYSEIPPKSRAAYLEWLSSGRTATDIAIGYVFLFFYGLERRLLADAKQSTAVAGEREVILDEVARLLGIYKESASFRSYAGSLLDMMHAQRTDRRLYELPPPVSRFGYFLPQTIRVALAQLAADGRPIPGDWAWSWLVCNPELFLRTPAHRCPEEFRTLFLARYSQQFGRGMTIKPNKSTVTLTYRPASASFGSSIERRVTDLPDVASLSGPMRALHELALACDEQLSPYSRWLGRNPGARNSVAAAALLPPELLEGDRRVIVQPLQRWLEGRLTEDRSSAITTSELLGFWPEVTNDRLAKAESVSVAQLLEKIGYAVEPDVRFGGPPLKRSGPAVVFRLPKPFPTAASPAYSGATLLLHVGAAVAEADGAITADEEGHLEGQLESALHLTDAERARLRAHLAWLVAAKPGLVGVKKRVNQLAESQRRNLGRYLVALAGSDGSFEPAEVSALTKMYRLLGLSVSEAYSDIHALASGAAAPPAIEPVTVQPEVISSTGHIIPPPPKHPELPPIKPVMLDPVRVRATLVQTKAVATLLAGIFTDNGEGGSPSSQSAPQAQGVAGLDAGHSSLIRALAERRSWSRAELETAAATHGLMPDGALDAINEVALERCGEPLCEGEDPITVDASVAKELLQ